MASSADIGSEGDSFRRMSPTDYALLSAAATGVALLAALSLRREESTPPPLVDTTRWKRFRVHFEALHGSLLETVPLVVEEPAGLQLSAARREAASTRRWTVLGSSGGAPVIEISRGLIFLRRRLRVLLQGKEWLHVLLPRPAERKARKPELKFLTPIGGYEVNGNIPGREFEVRRQGRLVASTFWEDTKDSAADRRNFLVEVLKTEESLPILSIVLALEVALDPDI